MAKKRKDKKFSKTKQRPKKKIRDAVDKMKGRLTVTDLAPNSEAARKAFSDTAGDAAAPLPPGTRAVRYAVFPKGVGVVYVRPGENVKDRVMQIDFTKTPPKGQAELNDSLRAVMEKNEASLGGVGDPPRVIAVAANSKDEEAVTSQLQQLVDDMNEEARGDKTKPQYEVRLLSSSLSGPVSLFGKRQVKLRYELTPVGADAPPPASPVMTSAELRAGLGKDAKLTGSRQYKDMLAALDAYNAQLADYTKSLNNTDDIPQRLQQARDSRNELLAAAKAYLSIHQRDRDKKKNSAVRLVEQIEQSHPSALMEEPVRRFVNELPNTLESHEAIEKTEKQLMENQGGSLLTVGLHELFFRKKTEILENVIERSIENSEHPGLTHLKNLGKENYWKILIDGNVHDKNDKHFYDRSKGYMASMMKGLGMIAAEIDKPLSTDFIIDLHTAATALVTNDQPIVRREVGKEDHVYTQEENWAVAYLKGHNFQEQGLKKAPNAWGVTREFSEDGMTELAALRDDLDKLVDRGYFYEENVRLEGIDRTVQWKAGKTQTGDELQGIVKKLMDQVIEKADREIEAAKAKQDQDGVIGAIIDCCRGLGVIHPFKDANGRLIMFLTLNKMLMQQGMPPTVLEDQGFMVGKSKAELTALIKQGQQKVLALSPAARPPVVVPSSDKGKEEL